MTITQKWQIPSESSYVKARLISDILQCLIAKNVVKESGEEVEEPRYLTGAVATSKEDPEVTKIKLQLELEKMKILNAQEEEERQITKDERKLKLAQEEETRRREAALQEVELQKKLAEIELSKTRETANIQLKTKEERNLHEKFDFNKAKKLIPTFDEKEPKVFFDTFEDTATSLEWPAEHWVMLIRNGIKDRFCNYCKQAGHLIEKCPDPQCRKSEVKEHKLGKNQDSNKTVHMTVPTPDLDSFKPYTCQGSVNGKPVVCLRDTGSSQTIINLPPQELTMKQEYVTDLTSTKTLPLAEVLIGNDLAGANALNLVVTDPDVILKQERKVNENKIVQSVSKVPKKNKTLETSKVEKALELVNLSKVKFQQLQSNDSSLTTYWKRVKNPSDNPKTPHFYTDHGLLFRHFRSSKAPVTSTWHDCHQLVLPVTLLPPLLYFAHTSESHLGVNKTYHRVLQDFFWPGIKKENKDYIMSCHQCQVTGRPNESIIRAPLQPISVPKQPFEKMIIDSVGPMPKTRKGKEYLLTVLCPTTRYPIAMPIKKINAKTIIGQLVEVFTTFGFPKILQCDRGTNFTSKLFKQSMQELNIHNVYASPYHPQTNGALERETTSNAKYGERNFIRNKEEYTTTLLAYMKELKEKFLSMYNFANESLLISQEKMSNLYNRKTKLREFNIGDQVLVYHPIPGAPLREKFMRPYTIISRPSKLNYIISTPDRRRPTQMVHVNLIKPYHAPANVVSHISSQTVSVDTTVQLKNQEVDEETPSEDNLVSWKDLLNSQVLESLPSYLAKIPPNHRKTLTKLLLKYSDVCSDQLKVSDTIKHDIILEPGTTPIRQPYYRVVGRRLESLRKEV
ncbi:uncharacterized protein [Palaemon carinicauda]|uniref:uncharacterized protein n=1 Tax=Palaemon carinicauda TaxID=392227 RepID=UPI0035B63D52